MLVNISLDDVFSDIQYVSEKITRFCFILGAGASRASGIRTGAELARLWLQELRQLDANATSIWQIENNINDENVSEYYAKIYSRRFRAWDKMGLLRLEEEMHRKVPSFGHIVLAKILSGKRHNVVVTTNFDSLIEDALYTNTNAKPIVIGHDSLAGFLNICSNLPIVAKIHNGLYFNPKNDEDSVEKLSDQWQESLKDVFKFYTPLVIGYGGNDGSLMSFLESLSSIVNNIYWFYKKSDGKPNERILKLLHKHNGYLVPIIGFDELMLQFAEKLGLRLSDIFFMKPITTDDEFSKLSNIFNTETFYDKDGQPNNLFKSFYALGQEDKYAEYFYEFIAIHDISNNINRKLLLEKAFEKYPDNTRIIKSYVNCLCDIGEHAKALIICEAKNFSLATYVIRLMFIKEFKNMNRYSVENKNTSPYHDTADLYSTVINAYLMFMLGESEKGKEELAALANLINDVGAENTQGYGSNIDAEQAEVHLKVFKIIFIDEGITTEEKHRIQKVLFHRNVIANGEQVVEYANINGNKNIDTLREIFEGYFFNYSKLIK